VLSLVARIDELSEQNKKLLARIAELEARCGKPPKTPTNSSVPPSRGPKGNVGDASGEKKGRKGRPGVARELCPNPDVTHNIFAERCDCGGKVTHKGQVLTHAYDHVELPPIKPTTTRINLHSADLRGEPGSRAELSFRLPNLSR
jgi:transposase